MCSANWCWRIGLRHYMATNNGSPRRMSRMWLLSRETKAKIARSWCQTWVSGLIVSPGSNMAAWHTPITTSCTYAMSWDASHDTNWLKLKYFDFATLGLYKMIELIAQGVQRHEDVVTARWILRTLKSFLGGASFIRICFIDGDWASRLASRMECPWLELVLDRGVAILQYWLHVRQNIEVSILQYWGINTEVKN